MNVRFALGGAWLGLGLLAGCGPALDFPHLDGSTGAQTSSPPTTSSAPPQDSSTGQPGDGSTSIGPTGAVDDGSDTAGGGFIPYDDLDPDRWCSVYAQDCPAGQKCIPYSDDGGPAWNAAGCFPIAEDPSGVDEPCTVTDSAYSGLDTCDLGLMCWDVDPDTMEGTCFALCTGSERAPICDEPNAHCAIAADGALVLCIPTCDPLGDDCPRGEGCYDQFDYFTCVPDGADPPAAAGDPCMFTNSCSPGYACLDASLVPDCPSFACCSAYCYVGEEPTACLPGQVCTPWFEPGQAPPEFEHVGICTLP
ncbi:MAG: hypothetical protein KDK70_38245 [Myxococcales bacterium]|nr:hypothetical protein [Myxococcales bacterium]